MSQDEHGETVSTPHVPEKDVPPVNSESESLDSVFRALSDYRRRCICHYLAQADDPLPLDELAELLAASMTEKTRAVLTSAEIEKALTEIHRIHLPKLTETGIVEYDEEDGVLRLTDSPGVADCLQAAEGVDLQ